MSILVKWWSSAQREARAVRRALSELSDQKAPVRVDVEGLGLHFLTLVSVHRSGLLLAKPRSLRTQIARDTMVRLTLPNRARRQVRMPVLVPDVRLPLTVKHAFICSMPDHFSGQCQRVADRYTTVRYKSLLLQVPSEEKSFRVFNLSQSGLRILANGPPMAERFVPGQELGPGALRIGHRVQVALSSLIPRNLQDRTVGLQMTVGDDQRSQRYLERLLQRLQQQELLRLRVETA